MVSLYVGYTLADIVGFARERTFTYQECAEILERELMNRFPWINPHTFYPLIRQNAGSDEDYCHNLVEAGRKLTEVTRS